MPGSAEKKVLVVDDEPRTLASVEDLLEDEFKVLPTTDAHEALRLLEQERVAVILADQRMPGLSGDQFLSQAREISDATRVLTTGYADLEAAVRAINNAHIYAYVVKPWDVMELQDTVRKAADLYVKAQAAVSSRRTAKERKNLPILFADDDPDDRRTLSDALRKTRMINELHVVENGEILMDYLHRRGRFTDPDDAPFPSLIIIDLNMPKKNGLETLAEIKSAPKFRHIPVVMMTGSHNEPEILLAYALGVSGFITKSISFDALVKTMEALDHYWFEVVELPLAPVFPRE